MASQRRTKSKVKKESMGDDAQVHAPAAHRVLFNQELFSTILELLRELEDEGEIPKLHPLLFVNKSFFQTTADLLWKDMESFQPFIQSFLPLVGQMPSPEVLDSLVDGSLWERFLFYSSRTATLTISSETASHGYWISFLLSQHSRPRILFPKLRTLNLCAADIAAITILSAAAPRLSACNIYKSDSTNFAKAAIAALTLNCEQLSSFTTGVNLSEGTMRHLARMRGLENVTLRGKRLQAQWAELSSIGCITGLRTLALEYAYDDHATGSLSTDYSPSIDDVLGAESQVPHLEKLLVSGDSITQHKIARGIALPQGLRQLDLIVQTPDTARILLLPNVFRLYLERNRKLNRFRVKLESDPYGHYYATHEHIDNFRGNPLYQDSAVFLPALSQAKSLTEIKIDGVRFLDKDILLKISELLPSFPSLERLTLRVKDFSYRARPANVPALSIFETLSASCPHLKWFDVPLTWTETPALPQRPSSHRLPRMFIAGGRTIQSVTFQEKIAIARYLTALFPDLQALLCSTEKPLGSADKVWASRYFDPPVNSLWSAMERPSKEYEWEGREKTFWSEIEGLVLSYQETRRQAIAEVSRALPYHNA